MLSWGGWSLSDRVVNTTPPTRLSKAEDTIFRLLLEANGREVKTDLLHKTIGGSLPYLRHVLKKLRSGIGENSVINVRGVGYRLRKKRKNEAAELVKTLEKALKDARRLEATLDYT